MRIDGFTYADIAKEAGVSRQRIHQLIAPPKKVREYVVGRYHKRCADCNLYVGNSGHVHHEGTTHGEDYNDIDNLVLLCIGCHHRRHCPPLLARTYLCRHCGKVTTRGLYCSKDCFRLHHTITLVCSFCGKSFESLKSVANWRVERSQTGLIFCSKVCQGRWLGQHYGWGAGK